MSTKKLEIHVVEDHDEVIICILTSLTCKDELLFIIYVYVFKQNFKMYYKFYNTNCNNYCLFLIPDILRNLKIKKKLIKTLLL